MDAVPLVPRAKRRFMGLASAFVLIGVLSSWALSTAAQIRDSGDLDETAGVWAALAQQANAGTLYPALESDGRYGGTRYMPVPVLLHAGVARLTGEYFTSGKLLCGLYVLLALGAVALLGRRLGASASALWVPEIPHRAFRLFRAPPR